MDSVILKRTDHLQSCTISDVGESWELVAAEISLQDLAVRGSIENRAPCFEFPNACRSLFGMQLRHPRIVDVLAATHRVGEMDFPVVPAVGRAQGRGDSAFGHYGVGFTQE